MATKYVNTDQGLYDLTDPNNPKLLGNMTAHANTLAEQDFQNWKQQMSAPNAMGAANAEAEKSSYLSRAQARIYQDLLGQTEFRDTLTPAAPATDVEGTQGLKGANPNLPIQQGTMPTGYSGVNTNPDFNIATAGSGAVADFKVSLKDKNGNPIIVYNSSIPQLIKDGVLPNGTTAPTAPGIGGNVNLVKRDMSKENIAVGKLQGKGIIKPTPAQVNQEAYGTPNPTFSTPQGVITSDSFKGGTTATNLNGTTGGTGAGTSASSNANTAASSIIADIKARQDIYKQTQTDAQKKASTLDEQIQTLIGGEAGKAAYKEEQRKAKMGEGEANLNTQFTKSKNRIESLQAEKQKVLTDIEGKPITLSSIAGQQAQQIAKYNSEILLESAISNGLMNNITLAEQQIQQAVDAKFAPMEEALAIAKAQRDAIKGTLTADEKVQSDALDAADEAKKQAIADAKTEQVNIKNIMLEAMKAGITDSNILSKISNSKTLTEAMGVLGDNMPQANKTEMAEQKSLIGKGYQYVATPAERDGLRALGRTVTLVGGKTYVAPTKIIKTAKGGYNIVDSITNQKIGGQNPVDNSREKTTDKTLYPQVKAKLSSVVGGDGFVSPQDYLKWRNAYIAEGGNPTYFDTQARGFKNPNNPNYVTQKQTNSIGFK